MIHNLRTALGYASVPFWRAMFVAARRRPMAADEELDTVLDAGTLLGQHFRAVQVRSEIKSLLALLRKNPPKVVLEIGTASGGSLWLYTRAARHDASLVSVDIPRGGSAGYATWREPVYRGFAGSGQRVTLVRGDSHSPETIARVRGALRDEPVDFLMIDGDHSYEGAKADWLTYGPFVRPSGLIAFHDIVPGEAPRVGGVPRLWQEIKARATHQEFVNDWSQGGFGIGVVER